MRLHAMVAAALLLTACDAGNGTVEDTAPAADTPAQPVGQSADTVDESGVQDRPEVREDTVMVEGMPQLERATLVRSPAGFGPAFSTYVPDGMRTEFGSGGGGTSARFTAAFGGIDNPNAYMQVYVYAPGVERPTVNDVITGFVRSRAPGIDETTAIEEPEWALEALRFAYVGTGSARMVGRVMTGEHDGRFFHVVVHYPAEYGDGMGPRIDYILRHWRWEDTGEMLVR